MQVEEQDFALKFCFFGSYKKRKNIMGLLLMKNSHFLLESLTLFSFNDDYSVLKVISLNVTNINITDRPFMM